MTDPDPRIPPFESSIGLAALPPRGSQAFTIPWTALPRLPGFDESWSVSGRSLAVVSAEGAVGEWSFRRDDKVVASVDAFVSSVDYACAHRSLRHAVSLTSTPSIPYEPLPIGVGDLSVGYLGPRGGTIYWLTRNVCFHLSVRGSAMDLGPLVAAIDAVTTSISFSELATRRPSFDAVRVHPTRVHVNGAVEVEAALAAGAPSGSAVDYRSSGEALFVDTVSSSRARFGARQAGEAFIEIGAVDPETMLSSMEAIAVEVVEDPSLG